MKPQNLEEKIVWYTLIGTYALYFVGAQFPWISAISWFSAIYLSRKIWNQPEKSPEEEKITIPSATWLWIVSMLVMAIATIVGHVDFKLGNFQLLTSLFDFTKAWALFALVPLMGCHKIRPQLIYRAVCIICLQSIIFIGINYLIIGLHLPEIKYLSPLQLLGRGGRLYYRVLVGPSDFDPLSPTNEIRMQLLAPWPPALGLVGNIYFFLARQEADRKWRWIGMVGAIAMIAVSVSRTAMICLPGVMLATWLLTTIINKPLMQIALGITSFLGGVFAPLLIDLVATSKDAFTNARAGSSKIRKILKEIEIYRWREAPIWGHGLSEEGPKVTEHMPIGSHDTWVALLFVKGIVGLIALAVPLLWSFINLLIKAQSSKIASVGLSIVLVLFIFGFSEGIDILAYTYWPGLLLMGIAFKEKLPFFIKYNQKYD